MAASAELYDTSSTIQSLHHLHTCSQSDRICCLAQSDRSPSNRNLIRSRADISAALEQQAPQQRTPEITPGSVSRDMDRTEQMGRLVIRKGRLSQLPRVFDELSCQLLFLPEAFRIC